MQFTTEQPGFVPRRHTPPAAELPDERLLLQYRRGLVFLMRRQCGNPALAEDLCNEAFRIAIAYTQRAGLRKPDSFPAFLLQRPWQGAEIEQVPNLRGQFRLGGAGRADVGDAVGAEVELQRFKRAARRGEMIVRDSWRDRFIWLSGCAITCARN